MRKRQDEGEDAQKPTELEQALEALKDLQENGGVTISGRIYRILSPADQIGKQSTELVGKVDEFVDDDFVGKNFGPGRYKVRFMVKAPDETKAQEQILIFTVGKEYEKYKPSTREAPRDPEAVTAQTPRGGFLEQFLNGMTPDKMTAFSLAFKTIKEIFAPPPPPPAPDWSDLLKVILATREPQKPAMSDTIVLAAMDNLKHQQKAPSILDQLRQLKEIKEELKEDINSEKEDQEEDGENMNLLLKSALEYLPLLLQKNNNNFQAVGQQAAENPLVKNLVANDPELAQVFFEKAREKYGVENAKNLAHGFGLEMDIKPDEIGEIENG